MKKLTILLGVIFVFLLAGVILFFVGGTLNAQVQTLTANAAEYPEAFASIRNVLESNSAPQYFSAVGLGEANQYTLVDVTITLSNPGLFSAEWLDIHAEGTAGDVAVYSLTGSGSSIDARSQGQVNLKLITTAAPSAIRSYEIQYYVYGMKRSITIS